MWCGNSQSCRILSDKFNECVLNLETKVYIYKVHVYGEQDKSGEEMSKCPAAGSLVNSIPVVTCRVSNYLIIYPYHN